jgi:hypothetical protein
MRKTRAELVEVRQDIARLICPPGTETFINGERLRSPKSVYEIFGVTLETEISDEEGFLRKTKRKTSLAFYEVAPGEVAHLYEMGIPVVALPGGDRWHVDVGQKVPLNVDRDNVTPSYLRSVRVEVLNAMEAHLSKVDATQAWVSDAAGDERASEGAVTKVMDLRFGEKRVIADPTDPEGTKLAMSRGFTVIPGGAMSGDMWANVKKHGAALPAGQVTPSPKPYSDDGDPEKVVPVEKWTPEAKVFIRCAERLGEALLGTSVSARIVSEPHVSWAATYGHGSLALNVGRLGWQWFDSAFTNQEKQLSLLLHEFAHHYSHDHLSGEYHEAICKLGAKLAVLVINRTDGRDVLDLFEES